MPHPTFSPFVWVEKKANGFTHYYIVDKLTS